MLSTAWRSGLTGWQVSVWGRCLRAAAARTEQEGCWWKCSSSLELALRPQQVKWSKWDLVDSLEPCCLICQSLVTPPPLGLCILSKPLTWSLHTKAMNHCYFYDCPHNFFFNFIFFASRNEVKCKLLALSFTSWYSWLCKFRMWGKQGPARAISSWFIVLRYLLFTETEELNAF